MKVAIRLLIVCLIVLSCCEAGARGRKSKEPETVISKRGKLIFEDDFSGKELEWTFDPGQCDWQIVKKALVARKFADGAGGAKIGIYCPFTPVKDVILQFRIFVPPGSGTAVSVARPSAFPHPRIRAGSFCLSSYRSDTGLEDLVVSPFPYRKPAWVNVLYENVGSKYALTVDGKTITCDFPVTGERTIDRVTIVPSILSAEPLAIDDVKVWEALPKDEEENDKRGKK